MKTNYHLLRRKIRHLLGLNLRNIIGQNNLMNCERQCVNVDFDVKGDGNQIILPSTSFIRNTLIYIRGNKNLVQFGTDCYMNGGEIWIEDDECKLIVNNNVTIEDAHFAITENASQIEIKEDCMLSRHVEIRTGDSHSIIDEQSGLRINRASNVLLQNHVWLGAHSKILKGVTIGSNTVIGTNAIVTSNIPSGCIAAGIPARVVKTGINWDRKRI